MYEWVKLKEYYHHAKFDISHIFGARESRNIKAFATHRPRAALHWSLQKTHIFHVSKKNNNNKTNKKRRKKRIVACWEDRSVGCCILLINNPSWFYQQTSNPFEKWNSSNLLEKRNTNIQGETYVFDSFPIETAAKDRSKRYRLCVKNVRNIFHTWNVSWGHFQWVFEPSFYSPSPSLLLFWLLSLFLYKTADRFAELSLPP